MTTTANPLQTHYEDKYRAGVEIDRTSKRYTLECVPDDAPLEILDVGCGTGLNSRHLASRGHTVTGIDLSETAIERYREHGFTGHVMDIEQRIDLDDASFDCVFCSEVIEHVTDPGHLAAEMYRVTKPGGRLVLSTPNSAFWLYRVFGLLGKTVSEIQHPQHLQFFSVRGLCRILERAGYTIERTLGRNMYAIAPDLPGLGALGFRRETRYRTKKSFRHLSHRSGFWNSLWADTVIVVGKREL